MSIFTVYRVTHCESGKSYIGITKRTAEARWHRHVVMAGRRRSALGAAILKYGASAFFLEAVASSALLADALAVERIIIKQENTISPHGYNLTAGGEGVFQPSPEALEKLSAALRGKPKSAEHRAKISAHSPIRLNDEVRARISAKLKGKPTGRPAHPNAILALRTLNEKRRGTALSAEHRAAIGRAQTGKKRPPEVGEKIAASKRGKPRSAETKAKLSAYWATRRQMFAQMELA